MPNEFPKTLTTWKRRAAAYASSLLARGDMFADHDPYLVNDEAEDAFEAGELPKAYVRRVFADAIRDMEIILANEAEDFYGERL